MKNIIKFSTIVEENAKSLRDDELFCKLEKAAYSYWKFENAKKIAFRVLESYGYVDPIGSRYLKIIYQTLAFEVILNRPQLNGNCKCFYSFSECNITVDDVIEAINIERRQAIQSIDGIDDYSSNWYKTHEERLMEYRFFLEEGIKCSKREAIEIERDALDAFFDNVVDTCQKLVIELIKNYNYELEF